MSKAEKLEGPDFGPHGGGKPGHMVVLLHGYGADGNDLIGLAPLFGQLMPDTIFYAPNAPQPCEGNPFGYQWFPVSRLDPALALAGVRDAAPSVDLFLDEKMKEHGLDESKTVLIGFSQGTMMSLHVGLRRKKPLAGIIGFSGMLAGAEILKDEGKTKPPVLLVHGDADEMLPAGLSQRAAQALTEFGIETRLHIAPGLGHSIDDTGLQLAARFLLNVLDIPEPEGA
jgi:phospholipase/carboxylesterase